MRLLIARGNGVLNQRSIPNMQIGTQAFWNTLAEAPNAGGNSDHRGIKVLAPRIDKFLRELCTLLNDNPTIKRPSGRLANGRVRVSPVDVIEFDSVPVSLKLQSREVGMGLHHAAVVCVKPADKLEVMRIQQGACESACRAINGAAQGLFEHAMRNLGPLSQHIDRQRRWQTKRLVPKGLADTHASASCDALLRSEGRHTFTGCYQQQVG